MLAMSSRTKVISYGDFASVPGISKQKKTRKVINALVVMISITAILTYLMVNVVNKTSLTLTTKSKRFRHHNPCRHVTPEPEIIMEEKFDSNDYFFPRSFKERICASPTKSGSKDDENDEGLQMCFMDPIKGKHYCITRYRKFEVLRTPSPGNLTSKYRKVETIRVGVACECTRTEAAEIYGTSSTPSA